MITHRSSNVFVGWQTLTLNDGMSPPCHVPPCHLLWTFFNSYVTVLLYVNYDSLQRPWLIPQAPIPSSIVSICVMTCSFHYHRKMMLNSPKDDNTTKEPGCFECGTILIRSILLCGCTVSLQSIWIGNRVCELRCGFIIRGILRPLCMTEVFLYRPF